MKPHELIAALMHLEGGSLPLARKMGNVKMQSKLYKFSRGAVASPERPTAEALAAYFKMPVDAIYDERVATAIARERGISALPVELLAAKKKPAAEKTPEEKEIENFTAAYRKMSPTERQRLRLLMLAAVDPKHPSENWRAPGRPARDDRDNFLGGESGLGGLDEIPPAKKGGEQ